MRLKLYIMLDTWNLIPYKEAYPDHGGLSDGYNYTSYAFLCFTLQKAVKVNG